MTWFLQDAINQALTILNWYENYVEAEIPPEPLWDDGEAVTKWFKEVKRKHDEKFGQPSKPDNGDDSTEEDGNSMVGNELADHFR